MSKLYIGNLPSHVDEEMLKQLFVDHGLRCKTVLIKRGGYAFVDCVDQMNADLAIDIFNESVFFGNQLIVEPSIAGNLKGKNEYKADQKFFPVGSKETQNK